MTRTFDDFHAFLAAPLPAPPLHVQVGRYAAFALLEETGTRWCALGARCSHRSWARSTPESDVALLERLIARGPDHAKAMRWKQYLLLMHLPRYMWVEVDTYTVGMTPVGSTSTMYGECARLTGDALVEAKSNLPEGTMQLRVRAYSWHTLRWMAARRDEHRLPEWAEFGQFVNAITDLHAPFKAHENGECRVCWCVPRGGPIIAHHDGTEFVCNICNGTGKPNHKT